MPSYSAPQSMTPHWLVCAMMLTSLAVYNLLCHLFAEQIRVGNLPEADRVLIRTVLYVSAIVLFPLTNLVRHVLLRLNQTMPGPADARQRYFTTIVVTQAMIEIVSTFGLVMFVLGDDFNTLYIFTLLGVVGIYLHKPKIEELESIQDALSHRAG